MKLFLQRMFRNKSIDPFSALTITGFTFLGTLFVTTYGDSQRCVSEAQASENQKFMTDDEKKAMQKMNEVGRIPWPVLHHRATQMREGKLSLEGLESLWDDTKYFYDADWLIPVEFTQILKYHSPKFLSEFISSPEQMRKELLFQLLSIKHGRVKGVDIITTEIKEIISLSIESLSGLDVSDTQSLRLTATHSL